MWGGKFVLLVIHLKQLQYIFKARNLFLGIPFRLKLIILMVGNMFSVATLIERAETIPSGRYCAAFCFF